MIDAHVENDQNKTAIDVARKALDHFQSGDARQRVVVQHLLAKAYLSVENFDAALETTKEALTACETLEDPGLEAIILLTLSEAQFKLGTVREAVVSAEDASAIFRALSDEWHNAGMAQNQVAKTCAAMGDITRALEEVRLARDFFLKVGAVRCEGLAVLQEASILSLDPMASEEALRKCGQAAELFKEALDQGGAAVALYLATEVHVARGKLDAALETALERREVLKAQGFPQDEAKALHGVAAIHLAAKRTEEAARASKEGLRLARAADARRDEVHLLLQVTQAHTMSVVGGGDDLDRQVSLAEEAVSLSREAVAIARKVAGGKLRAAALFWHAYSLSFTAPESESLELADDALLLFRASKDRVSEAHTLLLTAQVMNSAGQRAPAIERAKLSLSIFQELSNTSGENLVSNFLREVAPSPAVMLQQEQPAFVDPAGQTAPVDSFESLQLAPAKAEVNPQEIKDRIMKIAIDALGDSEGVELDAPLMDLGLDSLSSVGLRNDMVKEFGVALSASVMFDHPSIGALAEHVYEKITED